MRLGLGIDIPRLALSAGGWSPLSLFQSSEAGLVYDAMDLSGFYADRDGATPAVVNSVCGLQIDKHLGTVGSNIIANGTFDSGSGWTTGTVGTTSVTISGGSAHYVTAGADYVGLTQVGVQTVGRWYLIEFDVLAGSSGNLKLISDGVSGGEIAFACTPGAKRFIAPASVTGFGFSRIAGQAADAYIDNVVVREMAGAHRYQLATAGRPILRGTPTGSNLVSNGGFDSGANWTPGVGWAIGSGVATATASLAALTSSLAATSGRVYLVRYKMTRSVGTLTPSFGGVTLTARSAGGTYEEFVTASSTAALVFTGAAFSGTVDDASVIDYSADVVTAPYALQMGAVAGVDRWMQTAAVDFSATDAMTACWGVRKHSDASQGCVAELTASVAANNGSWLLAAPDGATATFALDSKGTVQVDAVASGNTAPMAAVLAGLSDISGDSCSLRVNGAVGDTDAGDQGTGNYSNAALYFGKRAGTSLPFLGLDYGGVIRGALTTAELTSLERWVSARTPGTTIP